MQFGYAELLGSFAKEHTPVFIAVFYFYKTLCFFIMTRVWQNSTL